MAQLHYELGRTASASDSIEPTGTVAVYAKKEEIYRLNGLVHLSGWESLSLEIDPQRPSMAVLLIGFNERTPFEPVDLSMALESHK